MRISHVLWSTCLAVGITTGSVFEALGGFRRRQDNGLPTLGGGAGLPSGTASSTALVSGTATVTASGSSTPSSTASGSASGSAVASKSESTSNKTSVSAETTTTSKTSVPTAEPTPTQAETTNSSPEGLPIEPRITPALAIGGVVLLLTGVAYGLIGVKNRWVHVALSSAYLTSLSVCVLIVYVMNPPVSNAIQGAYFVGIFMTGLIFGAGALVFKEVTEGLGCLLGGFCLAMWFLTLKDGGLITNTTGKGIFIAIFCAVAWASSFSHYTRPYSLIGSTSFSGSTAFVLGVDCFSRGGLKEFWLWIWDLNPNLFPLNTPTYPISRGTRVETIVIIIGCLIGIMSQVKLWKVVRDRQKKRAIEQQDESRRQDAVEAALGRHLERRNDRDKSEWERQYGNLLQAKRQTILWTDSHREKKTYSQISETEMDGAKHSPSMDSLEMGTITQPPRSVYVARVKRQSAVNVDMIAEVDEPESTESHLRPQLPRSRSSDLLKRDSRLSIRSSAYGVGAQTSRESLRDQTHLPKPEDASGLGLEIKDPVYPSEPREYRSLKVGSRASHHSPGPEEYLVSRAGSRISLPIADAKENHRHSTASKRLTNTSIQHNSVDARAESAHAAEHTQVAGDRTSAYLAAPGKDPKKRRSWSSMFSKSSGKEHDYDEQRNVSQEALIVPSDNLHHSRASSLAATLDSENEVRDLNIDTTVSHVKMSPHIVISPVQPPDSGIDLGARKMIDVYPPPPALEEGEEIDADPEELVRPVTQPQQDGRDSTRQSSGLDSEGGTEILFEDGTRSHAETTNTSMSEVLTKGALEKLPSQLSNIVLSYRTNEWAKHASSAEAPVYEDSESTTEEIAEVPAHLLTADEVQKQAEIVEPPPLSRPMTAVTIQSPTAVADSNPSDGSKTNAASQDTSPLPSNAFSTSLQPQISTKKSRAPTELNRNNSATRGLHSSSSQMLVPTLATATIDENTAVDFGPQNYTRAVSSTSFQRLSGDSSTFAPAQHGYVHAGTHPYSSAPGNTPGIARSTSRLSHTSETNNVPTRSISQTSLHQPLGLINGRSDTRMASFNSHQPQRRNTDLESQRREAMFADWRMAQQANRSPKEFSEAHHAQRVFEKMQAKQAEEYERTMKAQQEIQLNVAMRSRDMQEAHREALRRMQAGVNKKLPN